MNDSSPEPPTSTLQAASDEDLAGRVQGGCANSFTELVQRLQPRLLFVLQRRLRNYADAEDVAQKTLLRTFEKIHLYDPTRKFTPWLFTIAFRLAADHQRQTKTTTPGESASAVVDPARTPEQQAILSEQSSDLWATAERVLKPDQWTALWLLYGEGQSVREIAQALGRTNVSVRVLLYRARKTLIPHLTTFAEFADDEPAKVAAQTAWQVVRAES